MKKKSIIALVLAMIMVLSLCACGGGSSDEGSSAGSNEVTFEEGTVIAENDYAKVEIVKLYDDNGSMCITLNVTNVGDREFNLWLKDNYIGENAVDASMYDGNTGPIPGKAGLYTYEIMYPDFTPIESMEQLYELEGVIELSIYSADGEYLEEDIELPYTLQGLK